MPADRPRKQLLRKSSLLAYGKQRIAGLLWVGLLMQHQTGHSCGRHKPTRPSLVFDHVAAVATPRWSRRCPSIYYLAIAFWTIVRRSSSRAALTDSSCCWRRRKWMNEYVRTPRGRRRRLASSQTKFLFARACPPVRPTSVVKDPSGVNQM